MTLDSRLLQLYLVTSGTGPEVARIAADVAGAGARFVQVRAKDVSSAQRLALAVDVARAVAAANPATRVVIDDDVAAVRRAMTDGEPIHGVHLGQDDMDVREARAMLGPDAIIGLTTGTLALVEAAQEVADVVDYLGAGPFRPTPTKDSGRPPLGVEGYRSLVAASSVPIVAIGDVTPDDVAALAGTGIAGVCMVRALMHADDPGATAARALAEFRRVRH